VAGRHHNIAQSRPALHPKTVPFRLFTDLASEADAREKSGMASELAAWGVAQQSWESRKASSRPIDLVHLSRYTLGERELEREVLELFCSQSLLYIERLRHAKSDQDWKEAAHSLLDSARMIGAWSAGEAAERAEALSGDAFGRLREMRLAEIESTVREAEDYIDCLLRDR
jgi:HPt (histidine-containing phosphotransfer) domain-containing protein